MEAAHLGGGRVGCCWVDRILPPPPNTLQGSFFSHFYPSLPGSATGISPNPTLGGCALFLRDICIPTENFLRSKRSHSRPQEMELCRAHAGQAGQHGQAGRGPNESCSSLRPAAPGGPSLFPAPAPKEPGRPPACTSHRRAWEPALLGRLQEKTLARQWCPRMAPSGSRASFLSQEVQSQLQAMVLESHQAPTSHWPRLCGRLTHL